MTHTPSQPRRQEPGLPTTAYALLGLLSFDPPGAASTGYELKRRADASLRHFWFSPAMSQVYAELARLERRGLVHVPAAPGEAGGGRRFAVTDTGRSELQRWLATSDVEFPSIKHTVALRLFLGAQQDPDRLREVLDGYRQQLQHRIGELVEVCAALEEQPYGQYPALVAEWGRRFYGAEAEVVTDLLGRLPD